MSPVVAVMQPYVFPYLGYFSLVEASDVFVVYDDVNYIPRGWINRNRLLINGSEFTFTLPVANASQNDRIHEVKLHGYTAFRQKFLKQIRLAYGKAACFDAGFSYVEAVMTPGRETISEVATASIEEVFKSLGSGKHIVRSSECASASRGMERADRLIAITKSFGAASYVNAMGGTALYDKRYFLERGVTLSFVRPRLREYPQVRASRFVPGLSIIDVLMNNPGERVLEMIRDYELV
ncbi:MAG: WbqC family protein [Rhodocyclales bacterium]|nr:WbqC family protein [Rhodocyclales bacterium]